MELALSLGDASGFLPDTTTSPNTPQKSTSNKGPAGLDFCMDLSLGSPADGNRIKPQKSPENAGESDDDSDDEDSEEDLGSDFNREGSEGAAPVQLNLLPLSPVHRRISPNFFSMPWTSDNGVWEKNSPGNGGPAASARGLDVNGMPEEALGLYGNGGEKKRMFEGAMGNDGVEGEKTWFRASDDEENGANSRKKLRLSKEQSAFLEESFKEHHTLNPKQKVGLAKQLNLRPRQVEVWFQNRRARTKLKQTEVDCEYLKRCCDTLTEENRRLHKELQELRALKASSYPHLPATTLTMCPSCERVATAAPPPPPPDSGGPFPVKPKAKPIFYPFSHPNQPAASS